MERESPNVSERKAAMKRIYTYLRPEPQAALCKTKRTIKRTQFYADMYLLHICCPVNPSQAVQSIGKAGAARVDGERRDWTRKVLASNHEKNSISRDCASGRFLTQTMTKGGLTVHVPNPGKSACRRCVSHVRQGDAR